MANIAEIRLVLVLAFVVVTTADPFFRGGFFFNGCHFKHCHRYAKCEINENHRAVCVCPQLCPKSYEPVCGTDWKTYNNYCELTKKSCDENSPTLKLRYYGRCKSGSCRSTPWRNLQCPYYSRCELYYGLPSCVCPREFCPSGYKPVCGSDSRTYRNSCELRKAGCKQRKRLYVKHLGHCRPDPCALIDCCCRAQCRVNETNHARCECNFACTLQFDPVCGSDGRTYGNACGLSSAACAQQNPKFVVVSNGRCPTPAPETTTPTAPITLNPCSVIKCGFFAKCEVINGSAGCTCPSLCPAVQKPVCGSNGVTYGNFCELQRDSCKNEQFIEVANEGPCPDPCALIDCCCGARCRVNETNHARCDCTFSCSLQFDPVCGSDGETYGNACGLTSEACAQQNPKLVVVSNGRCPTPAPETTTPTPEWTTPEWTTPPNTPEWTTPPNTPEWATPPNTPELTTPEWTTPKWTPSPILPEVTSQPGVTTPTPAPETTTPAAPITLNPCSVIKCGFFAKCEVINGSAGCTCPTLCPAVQKPVCGSNGVTYGNVCELQRDSCKNEQFIEVANEGPCLKTVPVDACSGVKCGFHARCEVNNGSARCVCPSICLHVHNLLCGSDGVTYGNLCELEKASCEQQKHITIDKRGACGPTFSCPSPRICHVFCDKNECAKRGQICCCRGCGNVCTTPIKLSGRAVCPPDDNQCLTDEGCPGDKKCCLDGCSKRCVKPVVSVDTKITKLENQVTN